MKKSVMYKLLRLSCTVKLLNKYYKIMKYNCTIF